jgi:hypothetical protein
MRNKILITIILILDLGVYSQEVNQQSNVGFCESNGAYYKDTENFLPQFEGTWRHVSDTMELTFEFKKKSMMPHQVGNNNCFYDFLVGEMRLVLNGLELINSLGDLQINHEDVYKYNLNGYLRINLLGAPKCNDCPPNTFRIYMNYNEKQNDDLCLKADFAMRVVMVNGSPQLIVQKIFTTPPCGDHRYYANQTSTSTQFYLPDGTYTCIKID